MDAGYDDIWCKEQLFNRDNFKIAVHAQRFMNSSLYECPLYTVKLYVKYIENNQNLNHKYASKHKGYKIWFPCYMFNKA